MLVLESPGEEAGGAGAGEGSRGGAGLDLDLDLALREVVGLGGGIFGVLGFGLEDGGYDMVAVCL